MDRQLGRSPIILNDPTLGERDDSPRADTIYSPFNVNLPFVNECLEGANGSHALWQAFDSKQHAKSASAWMARQSRSTHVTESDTESVQSAPSQARHRASSAPDYCRNIEPTSTAHAQGSHGPENPSLLQVPADPHHPHRFYSSSSVSSDEGSSPLIIRVPSPLIRAIPSPVQQPTPSVSFATSADDSMSYGADYDLLLEAMNAEDASCLSSGGESLYLQAKGSFSLKQAASDFDDNSDLENDEYERVTRTNSDVYEPSEELLAAERKEKFNALMADWEAATIALFQRHSDPNCGAEDGSENYLQPLNSASRATPQTPSLTLNNDSTNLLYREGYFSEKVTSNNSFSSATTLQQYPYFEQTLRPIFQSRDGSISNVSVSSFAGDSASNVSQNSSCSSSSAFDNLALCLQASNLSLQASAERYGDAPFRSNLSQTTKPWFSNERIGAKASSGALYQCPQCGKVFHRPYALKSHYRSHSTEKPFACQYPGCQAAFQRKHDLRRHEKLHSGKKMYVCKICDKSFVRSDALTRHLKSSDTNLPSNCGYRLLEREPGRRLNAKTANKIGNLITAKQGRPKQSTTVKPSSSTANDSTSTAFFD